MKLEERVGWIIFYLAAVQVDRGLQGLRSSGSFLHKVRFVGPFRLLSVVHLLISNNSMSGDVLVVR
jgi:hypothetical protein